MDFLSHLKRAASLYKVLTILIFTSILIACDGGSSSTNSASITVDSTTPANLATGVSRTNAVTATFNQNIRLSSINNTRFTLQGPDEFIASSVSASGASATLTPDDALAILTPYTATLSSSISGLSDNALGTDHSWSFNTEDGLWGIAEPIESDNAGDAGTPHIAFDVQGNALAVWQQSDGTVEYIWANRYTPDSGWGTATLIELDNAGNADMPHIAVDKQGNALAVWHQDDGSRYNIWANRYIPGNGWGTATLIESDNAGNALRPQIAIDEEGNALAVWYQDDGSRDNIWANHYIPGIGWSTAALIESDNVGHARYPTIAIDGQGNALAVWFQYSGGPSDIWANRYIPGSGWGTAELIESDNTGSASFPKVAIDAQGNALAVWFQYGTGPANVWANRFVTGSGWGTATLIENDDAGTGASPQIAFDTQGNALAVWNQYDGSRYNIWANRYIPGSGWDTAELIESDNAGGANRPHIAIDEQGNALAVWHQSDGSRTNIWANRYTPGSGWDTAELIESDNAGDAVNPHIAIDKQGNALAVWYQSDGSRDNIWANRFE